MSEASYRFTVTNARLAFPNLWKAKSGPDGGDPTFSAAFIIPKDHPIIAEINKASVKLGREKWGEKADVILKGLKAQDRLAVHDGDAKAQYAGYEGNAFINARSKVRPSVVDRNRVQLTENDGKPYAGCYVNALIELWAQDNKAYGKRINASLRGVQFVKDGDAFAAGSTASEDEFADLGDQGSGGDEVDPLS